MLPTQGRAIAIVGAGFSGSLLALHLLRRCAPDDRILLIERNQRFGLGLAYSTGNPNHLLNVRAGNMSAFSDQPDHFVQWLRSLPAEMRATLPDDPGPNSFVPRGLFGRYVQQLLGDRIWRQGNDRNLFLVNDEAVAMHRQQDGWSVELAVGRKLPVDQAVLAIGNFPPRRSQPGYFGDPWAERALANLNSDAPVLLIGTGLTMIDTVISLLDQGHRGPIHAVSRRGLLPQRHGAVAQAWRFAKLPQGASLCRLLRDVRAAIREAASENINWRAVIDGLRPYTQRLWREMPIGERQRFLRHLRPWWDVHRHRAAPRIDSRIQEARERGQLRIAAARIGRIEHCIETVQVTLTARHGDRSVLNVNRVIDCSGLQSDLAKIDGPLIRQLLDAGHIRADALRLGIDIADGGAAINTAGERHADLFAIGPMTKGASWEITAVPDIRLACEELAARLLILPATQAPPPSSSADILPFDPPARPQRAR
ncbi:FAD/NAD(P)-binding protein [Dongia soli]|uniref:FAD/NAD(P)-binding protein n=1 Tax=Dongia soli TaxID=600628 RepID=A0ABU5EAF0_9PROT|nr:FAD/NAD(P)-binding protein [Dongia soli]MDY0883333.1 FAD/NAD(P)-binding protein [Dongia soli]